MDNKQNPNINQAQQQYNTAPVQTTNSILTTSSSLGSITLGGGLSGGLAGTSTYGGYPGYPYNIQSYQPYNAVYMLSTNYSIEKAENGYVIRRSDGKVYVCERKEDLIKHIE